MRPARTLLVLCFVAFVACGDEGAVSEPDLPMAVDTVDGETSDGGLSPDGDAALEPDGAPPLSPDVAVDSAGGPDAPPVPDLSLIHI